MRVEARKKKQKKTKKNGITCAFSNKKARGLFCFLLEGRPMISQIRRDWFHSGVTKFTARASPTNKQTTPKSILLCPLALIGAYVVNWATPGNAISLIQGETLLNL